MFRGYLYMLIYVIGAGLAMVAVLYAMVMSAVWSALHGRGFDLWGFLATFIAVVVLFTVGVLVIFFRYHFRGFMALYRLGFKAAWLLAWGPVITLILMAAVIGVVVVSAPAVLFRGDILGALAAGVAVMALLAAAFGVGVAVLVARLVLLRRLHRYTGINLFNIAFVLALVGLVFYAAYYLYILTYSRPYGFAAPSPAVGLAALGGIVSFAAYIVEMLAYKEGAEWTAKAQPTAPA